MLVTILVIILLSCIAGYYVYVNASFLGGAGYDELPSQIAEILGVILILSFVCLLILLLAVTAFVFSPFLVAWRKQPVFTALRLSCKSCFKNWRACLVNGLCFFVLYIPIFGIINFISDDPLSFIANPLAVIGYLIVSAVLNVVLVSNVYYSFESIFPEEAAPALEPLAGEPAPVGNIA